MKPRLQRRDWLHLQRFAPCESSTTCSEVVSGPGLLRNDPPDRFGPLKADRSLPGVANRCICSHSRRFARGLMNNPGAGAAAGARHCQRTSGAGHQRETDGKRPEFPTGSRRPQRRETDSTGERVSERMGEDTMWPCPVSDPESAPSCSSRSRTHGLGTVG